MNAHMPPQIPEIDVAAIPADAHLLDVREPIEWLAGHIEGAQHIPMNEVPTRLTEIPEEGEIVVICKGGGRSAQVTAYLAEHGRRAVNLSGGMIAWDRAGKPMVSDSGEVPFLY